MSMTKKPTPSPADVRRFNLSRWLKTNPVPVDEKSYFSQLINNGASFGEKAARRLEGQYLMGGGYLDTPISVDEEKAEEKAKPKDRLNELLNGDPIAGREAGILKCFRGCKEEDKEILMMLANKLYERAYPNDGTANPNNRKRKNSPREIFLGNVEERREEDSHAANNKDSGVQK